MFSKLFRAAHGSRTAGRDPLPGQDQDEDQDQGLDPDLRRSQRDSLRHHDASPGPATNRTYAQLRHATADFTEADDDDEDDDSVRGAGMDNGSLSRGDRLPEDEDGNRRPSEVLPLFSASHLDSLPVYNIVHAIRIIVQARTDTMLTWEQLRSPQVSQFLVKPMQQLIRIHHFSRATLYALMANCLQFCKEGQLFPGNAGTSSTRGKVCELLAIKLLKEYSTRELIDALSYDFNPLQGISTGPQSQQRLTTAARTSTLEVAIRASAKHFLAHPLVVQQLEAIWNGAISFYSSADSLHRETANPPPAVLSPGSAATNSQGWTRSSRNGARGPARRGSNDPRAPLLGGANHQAPSYHGQQQHQFGKEDQDRHMQPQYQAQLEGPRRRTVMLYNPRNASLFKLSRLRVPRYRQFLSTCSLAVLIALFLAVLVQRSSRITTLELVFWFWSAGFMLDELVGFTEQGFSLYIMSFWNIFDLGILLLLIFYYSLRVCGVFLADAQRWNDSAYDILAANAILLLPRIFSVLDHYQYFSQLLIAFRLMAVDLAAVFVLVIIACSGFFVFFTLSHNDNDPSDIAYKIFQIIMGFTPAAWEVWVTYNFLGKIIMGFFLIICHFVIVTILVTVLSNSFMEIASNANEEHQFLFAINTISMVKNDSLFSYIAPTNIFAWMMMPLRYCMPLPHFVALNRLVIKITHFPLLFGIFFYEKFVLAPFMYEPTDLVEDSSRARQRIVSFAGLGGRTAIFSPSIRLREESVVGYQKDRALDEVFRRTPDIASLRTHRRNERHKTQTAVRNWMDHNDGLAVSNYSNLDGINMQRERGPHRFRHISEARSAASDPADLMSLSAFRPSREEVDNELLRGPFDIAFKDHTDAEGDDELVTNDEDEDNTTNAGDPSGMPGQRKAEMEDEDNGDSDELDGAFIPTPTASRFLNMAARSPQSENSGARHEDAAPDGRYQGETTPAARPRPGASRQALHTRALSTNTILYNPPAVFSGDENTPTVQSPKMFSPPSPSPALQPRSRPRKAGASGTPSPGQRSPRRSVHQASRPQPIIPPKDQAKSAPNRAAGVFTNASLLNTPVRRAQRRLSSFDADTEAPSDLVSAISPPMVDEATFATLPGSFTSQLALAQVMNARASGENERDRDRMSRLVLARMKTLEESFTDVVRELRSLQKQQQSHNPTASEKSGSNSAHNSDADDVAAKSSGTRHQADQSMLEMAMTMASTGGGARRRVPGSGSSGSDSRNRPGTDGHGKKAKGKEVERSIIDENGEYGSFVGLGG